MVTVISEKYAKLLKGDLQPPSKWLHGPDRQPLSVMGEVIKCMPINHHWRFMGMAGKVSSQAGRTLKPICVLLSPRAAWVWGPAQEEAFNAIKSELAQGHYNRPQKRQQNGGHKSTLYNTVEPV